MNRLIRASNLRIPFRQSFHHAAAQRRCTETVWVEIEAPDGTTGFGEGCPRHYVTGETVDSALAFIRKVGPEAGALATVEQLRTWVNGHAAEIDRHPAAWCAVELALLDVLAHDAKQPVEVLLGLPALAHSFGYSAVLGSEPPEIFVQQARRYAQLGFSDFKLKLSGDADDFARLDALRASGATVNSLRFDANNLWRAPEEAIRHLARVQESFFAIEEPLPAGRYEELRKIADATRANIILDESLLRHEQLAALRADPERWIVNLRISKLGGLLRSLAVAKSAHALGLRLIVGCQVGETSLLTRAALTLAQAAQEWNLLAQEGAFGTHILAEDVVARPLQFGAGGKLDLAPFGFHTATGWGLQPRIPATARLDSEDTRETP